MSERTVFVVNAGVDIGSAVATGLAGLGRAVAWLDDGAGPPACEPPAAVARVAADFSSRATLAAAFDQAVQALGVPGQVVVSVLPLAALRPGPIGALDAGAWRASCDAAMKGVLHALQAGFALMRERGGSIVVVGPSLSLPGAPQLVALSAAVEGQRGLVKSSARQWGRHGVTVNWIAAAPRALSPAFDGLPLAVKPDPVMVALGRPMALAAEVSPVIAFLGSPAGRAMTGSTLLVDGGEWMVP
jgi:NAD(P)-dependent dehydrogenase (short-subunit alcohol dehydrogenase family)